MVYIILFYVKRFSIRNNQQLAFTIYLAVEGEGEGEGLSLMHTLTLMKFDLFFRRKHWIFKTFAPFLMQG